MNIFDGGRHPQQLHALNRCNSPDLEPFKQLLAEVISDIKDSLVRVDEEQRFRRLQGRAEALEDLLQAIERAPDLMERLR